MGNWNNVKKYLIAFTFFMLTVVSSFADPGDPPCDDQEGGPDSCPLPLDTWIYILVIAAVIYGAYRMYKKQKAFVV